MSDLVVVKTVTRAVIANMLKPGERELRQVPVPAGGLSVAALVADVPAIELCVWVDDVRVPLDARAATLLHGGEQVVVVVTAGDPISTGTKIIGFLSPELFLSSIGSFAFTASAFVIGTIALTVANRLVGALLAPPRRTADAVQSPDPVHSISSGSNAARPYGPIPVLLGEMRVFPDLVARPYTEMAQQATGTTTVNQVCAQLDILHTTAGGSYAEGFLPYPNAAWALEGYFGIHAQTVTWVDQCGLFAGSESQDPENPNKTQTLYYSTGSVRPLGYYRPIVVDTEGGQVLELNGPFTTLPLVVTAAARFRRVEQSETIVTFEQAQRLTQIFGLGWGDLTLSDFRIGQTGLLSYRGAQVNVAALTNTASVLSGYPATSYLNASGAYPEDVDTETGAELEQNANVADSGWITRRSPKRTTVVMIDVQGRLLYQGDKGPQSRSATVEVQYRLVGAPAWTSLTDLVLTNSSVNTLRETYVFNAGDAQVEVRVRKVTADETDARAVCQLACTEMRFQQVVSGAVTTGQNRVGIVLLASGQLSGAVDRLNMLAQAKTWVWTGAAWSWQLTKNPAWWFLHFARGGFYHPTGGAAGAPTFGKGWCLGRQALHGDRLFGVGMTDAELDLETLKAWAAFCDAQALSFSALVADGGSAFATLIAIARCGRARPSWASGKLGVVWEAANQPAVARFGMGNIVAGSFSIAYLTEKLAEEVVATYIDAADEYKSKQFRALQPGIVNPQSSSAVELFGVVSEQQAQRDTRLLAAQQLFARRRIAWQCDLEALVVTSGDVVLLSHDLTQWAHSGRVANVVLTGAVLSFEIDAPIYGDGSNLYCQVQLPDGTVLSGQLAAFGGDARVMTLASAWWPVAQAPGVLNDVGAVNAASNFADHSAEDFLYFIGPVATPGKRVRIVSIAPRGENRFELTAVDDDPLLWTYEYGAGSAPPAIDGTERIEARARNVGVTLEGAKRFLGFELDGADAALVYASVNGGGTAQVPVQGYLVVAGVRLELPVYAPGSVVSLTVTPAPAMPADLLISDSLTFTA
jgi:hypothetical protein